MMKRLLQPEHLDSLPPGDPAAVRCRRDLRIINRVMRNYAWMRQTLCRHRRENDNVLEIGAGAGDLVRGQPALGTVDGLDFAPRPNDWPSQARWYQTDVLNFEDWPRYPIVMGNLVFHHFDLPTLRSLGSHWREHARVIIACEPVRRRRFQWALELICLACRAHPVTRHDGRISIAAGFVGDEFADQLGLSRDEWVVSATATGRGAYRFVAVKKGQSGAT